ncbi:unnamed protein product [Owenia fusiformis]|uniref:Transgelin n=1 Tax=Owenia fusiformis TaxID=6347 RepID=A0A8J1XW36_OWEFU|nr:unnamed protein product [Owenia fusiformis]
MAARPRGYGMTAEISRKIAGKYDEDLEQQARHWIEDVTGESLGEGDAPLGLDKFQAVLKDGRHLCNLINALRPGSVKKINAGSMAFKLMENINQFLTGCENFGVQKQDLFQTVDLYEKQNMVAVVNAIHALGRAAQKNGYNGPVLGPREAAANKREFSEEQLQAGKGVIGLQMGTNKGASQAGQNFGKQRMIID